MHLKAGRIELGPSLNFLNLVILVILEIVATVALITDRCYLEPDDRNSNFTSNRNIKYNFSTDT